MRFRCRLRGRKEDRRVTPNIGRTKTRFFNSPLRQEIARRFDFKGSGYALDQIDELITVQAEDDFRLRRIRDARRAKARISPHLRVMVYTPGPLYSSP